MARQRSSSTSGKKPAKAPAIRTPARAQATRAPAKGRTIVGSPPTLSPQSLPTELGAPTRSRFTLYNLLGKPRAYYQVERQELDRSRKLAAAEKSIAHSVVIIDRSGSMAPYLDDLKETLVKILTLDEYSQYDLLVTLISYSSQGRCDVHFERTPIQEIMKRDSQHLQEIQKIHVDGATCISQALQKAAELCRDGELTCVTLHSDGYANDPSPNGEVRNIEELCADMQKRPVFVNTIAYTDSSDFRLLSKVANTVSGSCLKAGNIKQVYDALYTTEKLLGSSAMAPIDLPLEKGCDYQVFVSHQGNKINGSAGPLQIRGLSEEDDAIVYRYRKLTEAEYRKLKDVPEVQTSEAVVAFARTQLSEGAVNTAKYAVASTYDATLVERHGKALTNLQVAALAQDLDTVLFQPAILQEHEVLDRVPVRSRISVVALADLLAEHQGEFAVNLEHLRSNYVRRGVRRVQGTRDDSGNLIEPTLETECTDKGDYAPVSSFDINRNTANLNMLIARPVRLVTRDGSKPITEVAGIKLDRLSTFNNYTVVGDGELNVPTLKIRISSKKLFDLLKNEGVLEQEDGQPAPLTQPSPPGGGEGRVRLTPPSPPGGEGRVRGAKYAADTDYILRLDNLPLVPPFEGAIPLEGVFEDLAEMKVLSSILAAHLKEVSEVYTAEQVEALKKHYLSKNLYLNFPTTTEYTDLQQALAEGTVDSRVSYKIDIGSSKVLNMGKLMPANKFLDRLYEVIDANGRKIDKPTFEVFLDGSVSARHKQLSPRTKITAVDEFMRRVFDDFLGLTSNGVVSGILKRAGAGDLAKLLQERARGKKVSAKEYTAALTDARRKLDAYSEGLYHEKVSPLVFYIGATGVLPDEMDTRALTAEQLTAKYPDLALSRDEQEGLFFEIGDTILSVYAKTEYFSR